MVHELKIKPEYYEAVKDGRKSFEVRRNDRGYKVGDLLILKEWHDGAFVPGCELQFLVTYVLDDEEYLQPGYVILGLGLPKRTIIMNVNQNGNNNMTIGSVGTLRM